MANQEHSVPSATRCATCGTPIDALRASRVALFFDRFQYFCSPACREDYVPEPRITPPPDERRTPTRSARPSQPSPLPQRAEHAQSPATAVTPAPSATPGHEAGRTAPAAVHGAAATTSSPERSLKRDRTLLALAAAAAALGGALALLGDALVVLALRSTLLAVAIGGVAFSLWRRRRDRTELPPILLLCAPLASLALFVLTLSTPHEAAAAVGMLTSVSTLALALGLWLLRPLQLAQDSERAAIEERLNVSGQRLEGENLIPTPAGDLRPGEEIVLEAGEVAPVDAVVSGGTGVVRPWLSAGTTLQRHEGHPLVAGARVESGRLRAVVSWTDLDRSYMRLTRDPARRADLHAPLCRLGRHLSIRGGIALALLVFAVSSAAGIDLLWSAIHGLAALAALTNPMLSQIAALETTRGILAGLGRGVVFKSAHAFDTAGRVTQGIFCARGTLLLGEPEVASIDAFGTRDPAEVLALAAGAESGSPEPLAIAVQRAARLRQVRPDGSRSHARIAGLGITAVASNGEPLVVGSRALMLRERISVATAEGTIAKLEALGRSVLLVARGGHLVGVLGMQDGLRAGARAAVQHLLDVGIEPVLLSGDARPTCEALGRAVDIDHVRPEILPGERGAEIQRLADSGATLAVIGRSPNDDGALTAAHVAVVLDVAGSTSGDWDIELASDDVRDAAFALRLAHRVRSEVKRTLTLALAPPALASVLVIIGLPAAMAPLGALLGSALAAMRYRLDPATG